MSRITRLVALALAALMFFATAGPAGAQTDEPERDEVRCTDLAENDRRCVDHPRPTDRCTDLAENDRRCTDRPTDRCNHHHHDRVDDHCHHHIDLDDPAQVRRLIKHFIAAGEWKLLVRLLHAIGLI